MSRFAKTDLSCKVQCALNSQTSLDHAQTAVNCYTCPLEASKLCTFIRNWHYYHKGPSSISPSCSSSNSQFKRNHPSIFFFSFSIRKLSHDDRIYSGKKQGHLFFFFLLWTQQRNQGTSRSTCLPNDEGGRGESAPPPPASPPPDPS